RIANCAGSKEKPVSLVGVQATTTEKREAAINFELNARVASPKINEHIFVQGCRFEGPYVTPVRLSDPTVTSNVVFTQNSPTNLFHAPKKTIPYSAVLGPIKVKPMPRLAASFCPST